MTNSKCIETDRKKNLTEVRGLNEPEKIYGELERQNAPEYDFFVPLAARWRKLDGDPDFYTDAEGKQQPYSYIKDLQEEIGDHLNKALAALEDANLDKLEGVFNRSISTSIEVLVKTINKLPMKIYEN